MKPGSLASHPKALVLVTVVRTLRTAADWDLDRAGLIELAANVENQTADSVAWSCPVCQATACDIGCPLAVVRS
jgi:hypothetical protein